MKCILRIALMLLVPLTGVSQNRFLDSLLDQLPLQADNDTNKVITLYKIAGEIYNDDPKQALPYAKLSVKLADEQNYKRGVAKSLNNLGLTYFNLGLYEEAVSCFFRSMRIREDSLNNEGLSRVYNNIGLCFDIRGDYGKASVYYQKSLDYAINTNDTAGIGASYINVGVVCYEQNDNKKGLEYFRKAIPFIEAAKDSFNLGNAYVNIGICYANLDMPDSAAYYYAKSLEIRLKNNDSYGVANAYNNLGELSFQKGEYEQAEEYFKNALLIAKEKGHASTVVAVYKNLAGYYSKSAKWDSAYKYENLLRLSEDSLYNINSEKEVAIQELRYETEKQQREENIRREAEERINKLFIMFLVVIIAVVTGFSIFLFNRMRVIRRQKSLIEIKNKEITDSITYAKRLQDAILPPDKLVKNLLPYSFILYKPRDIVAGDFYWVEKIALDNSRELRFAAVADCTGHGVPGAMVSVVCSNALNRAVHEFRITDPGLILNKVRDLVLETFENSENDVYDGMDIAICCIDSQNAVVTYAGAYNPLWIYRNASATLEEVKADKQPIGKFENMRPFTTHQVNIASGDYIYMFTDGYADQFGGPDGKKFKYSRLKETLLACGKLAAPDQQLRKLDNVFEQWRGNLEQVDDVCIIGIRL